MSRIASHALAVAIGLACGLGGASLYFSGSEDELRARFEAEFADTDSPRETHRSTRELGSSRDPSGRAGIEGTPTEEGGPEGIPLVSAALRELALDEITKGWKEIRQETIPESTLASVYSRFESGLAPLARDLGRRAAEALNDNEAWDRSLAEGDAVTLLKQAEKHAQPPPFDFLRDGKAIESFFKPRHGEHLVSAASREAIEDGSTFEFGPGVWDLSEFNSAMAKTEGAADVTIRGSGMDNTLLVLRSDLSPRGNIERLRIRDCTIHCNDNYLFDQRRGVVTMECERTRIVGFDMAAGSSCMIGAWRGSLLRMVDCRIEGGYGRADVGSGQLFRVDHEGVASRFDRCLIRQVQVYPDSGHHSFDACTLDEILDGKSFSNQKGIQLVDTRVTHFRHVDPETQRYRKVRHDLNDLFPDWKKRLRKP